jgi:hypothetical protein
LRYLLNTLLYPPKELGLTPANTVAVLYLDPSNGASSLAGHVTLQIADANVDLDYHDNGADMLQHRHISVGLYGHKEDPQHYLAAVGELMRQFQQLNMTMPMIACLPSLERELERGLDAAVLQSVSRLVEADHICFLHYGAQYTIEMMTMLLATKKQDAAFWEMETLVDSRLPQKISATIKRHRALQNYFHGRKGSFDGLSMSSHKPYEISYDDQDGDIAGCFMFGDVPLNHPLMMSRILNGSIIAIVECEEFDREVFTLGVDDGIPYMADTSSEFLLKSQSVGFGLVQGIDRDQKILRICTPRAVAQKLSHISPRSILLIHGVADSPVWAYQEDLQAGLEPCYIGKARRGMQVVKSRRFKKKI